MKDTGDYQFDAASPLMTAASKYGLDVEKIIGGDPAEIAKAQGLGIPVPGAAPGPAASTPPAVQSALATGAASQTPPAPSGHRPTSRNRRPQRRRPCSQTARPPSSITSGPIWRRPRFRRPTLPTRRRIPPERQPGRRRSAQQGRRKTTRTSGRSSRQANWGWITPRDSPALPRCNLRSRPFRQSGHCRRRSMTRPTRSTLQRPAGASCAVSSADFWRAQHGICGATEGALNPGAVGATPYGAPTRQFSIAAQQQAAQSAALDKQQTTLENSYKEDTGPREGRDPVHQRHREERGVWAERTGPDGHGGGARGYRQSARPARRLEGRSPKMDRGWQDADHGSWSYFRRRHLKKTPQRKPA